MISKELKINSNTSKTDLSEIKKWLEKEMEETGEGFYGNWDVIEKNFNNNNLITLSYLNFPIGFVTFYKFEIHVEIGIFVIESKYRRKGIGKIFYEKVAEYFILHNYLALKLFCSPPASEIFWKKMGFIEYPNIGYSEHRLTYYKPLIETQEISTNGKHNNKLELWSCEPYQKKDTPPTWSWDLDIDSNSPTLPIMQPCNDNWNLRWSKNGEIKQEDKVKYFRSNQKIIHFPPFLYIRAKDTNIH